jgi:hypothetical protein
MTSAEEGIGQDARAGRDNQGVLCALSGEDATVCGNPCRIRLAKLQEQDRGELVGLSQQPGRPELPVPIQLLHRKLGGRQQLGDLGA